MRLLLYLDATRQEVLTREQVEESLKDGIVSLPKSMEEVARNLDIRYQKDVLSMCAELAEAHSVEALAAVDTLRQDCCHEPSRELGRALHAEVGVIKRCIQAFQDALLQNGVEVKVTNERAEL